MSSSLLLDPRPFLAVQQVTVEPDGSRRLFVRIHTGTAGVLLKSLPAGESHQPLLPFLLGAARSLPRSYRGYALAWGVGAGAHPSTYTLRHDPRDEGVSNDHLVAPDYLALWGVDGGPDFVDGRGRPVSRDLVDLVGVYPALFVSNEDLAAGVAR